MRVTAERRADGVYVAAGVELIEPECRQESARAPGGVWVTSSKTARVGDKLGHETAKRLREATRHRNPYRVNYNRPSVLKRCACSAVYVGDPSARRCPACKREADRRATLAAVRRLRAKRRLPLPLAQQCRQCNAPMTAKRSTKAFCSGKCRVAAHRDRDRATAHAPNPDPAWG
jgi:hypothetical protein